MPSHYKTMAIIGYIAALCLIVAISVFTDLTRQSWFDDHAVRICVHAHPHAAAQCLTKVYGK